MLLVMSCLGSCAPANCELPLPQFPPAGPKVADELQNLSAEQYPATCDWIDRLDKLRRELKN